MNEKERKYIEDIRDNYKGKTSTPLDELIALDKKAKQPVLIFAFTLGIIAALVMGFGMCLAMKVIFASYGWVMPVGIAIGLLGIVLAAANYFLFKKLEQRGKDKYGEKILSLTSQLLGE